MTCDFAADDTGFMLGSGTWEETGLDMDSSEVRSIEHLAAGSRRTAHRISTRSNRCHADPASETPIAADGRARHAIRLFVRRTCRTSTSSYAQAMASSSSILRTVVVKTESSARSSIDAPGSEA